MKTKTDLFNAFKADFSRLCEAHGGVFNAKDTLGDGAAYHIPTAWGTLRASIHDDDRNNPYHLVSIFLQWRDYTGPQPWQFPFHGDFNSYSHKWNIHIARDTLAEASEYALRELEFRLKLLE